MKAGLRLGEHAGIIRDENRKSVYDFFQERPEATLTEAMRGLGMSYVTVSKHAKAIREGWRPAQ